MYQRYIVVSEDQLSFYWGGGQTIAESQRNLKKAGGKVSKIIATYRFTSELPFAPPDRLASPNEADAYMGSYGALIWERCQKEKLSL